MINDNLLGARAESIEDLCRSMLGLIIEALKFARGTQPMLD